MLGSGTTRPTPSNYLQVYCNRRSLGHNEKAKRPPSALTTTAQLFQREIIRRLPTSTWAATTLFPAGHPPLATFPRYDKYRIPDSFATTILGVHHESVEYGKGSGIVRRRGHNSTFEGNKVACIFRNKNRLPHFNI